MLLLPFDWYCSACFGILFVSILCTSCSHFCWYCFISFAVFCAPVLSLIHCFFSLSTFVIPSKCLKNFICPASKHCSSVFFSTQASLPNLWSANRLNQHKNEIQLFLNLNHIDIFLISETHFTLRSHFSIPGYNISYTNHPDGTAQGGTAILIKSTIAYYELMKYTEAEIQATSI